MRLFAQVPDLPDPNDLATRGTPYVLAVCVVSLSVALVWVFRLYRLDLQEKRAEFVAAVDRLAALHDAAEGRWRADMKEVSASFMTALKEQRAEFHAALKELVADLRGGMDAIGTRLDRVEDAVADRHR